MFPFKVYVATLGHVIEVWPCFRSWDTFIYQGHVLVSMFFIKWVKHGGTWKRGGWGWNITPKTLHVSVGYVLGAQVAWTLKHTLGHRPKLDMFQWVVGFEVLVSRFMFCGAWLPIGGNKHRATTETWHVSMLVCSRALIACAWKPVLGHLEANDAFMTCRWNNVREAMIVDIHTCA
jgi:hypothetical protein